MALPPTIIYQHRKENRKKCSLRGLEGREDLCFVLYPLEVLPDLREYCCLTMGDAPLLSKEDGERGLLLLDATWRYAERMTKALPAVEKRSLPSLLTAYPRRQEDCADPARGLASVEALFVAYHLMGRSTEGLLDSYHWRGDFLAKNRDFLVG